MIQYLILIFAFIPDIELSKEIDFSKIPQIYTKATYTTEATSDKITLSIL